MGSIMLDGKTLARPIEEDLATRVQKIKEKSGGVTPILGKPIAMMLLNANATVTICHSKTQGLSELIGLADIVVGAVGKPQFIQGAWIKDGSVVVDAGYHPGGVGDVELTAIEGRCSAYTPVPGGVGPMTIAWARSASGGRRGSPWRRAGRCRSSAGARGWRGLLIIPK